MQLPKFVLNDKVNDECESGYFYKEGEDIGRVLIIEFMDNETAIFNEIMEVLEKYPNFHRNEIQGEAKLSLPGFEIYPKRRKIYCNLQEIPLTAKEYDLFCLLTANKGQVLTYSQIYERVWKNISSDDERAVVGFHIHNLREKLYKVYPESPFIIRCVREVGYCLELNKDNIKTV